MRMVMNFYTVSALLIFITALLFGLVVYTKNHRALANKAFGLFALSVIGWSFFYYIWQISSASSQALLYTRILMAFAIFIPANYFFIAIAFLGQYKERRWELFTAYFLSTVFLILDATPWMVASVEKTKYHNLWPMAGPAFGLFLVVWFIIVLYPTILLYRARSATNDKEKRRQIATIMIGIFLAFLGGSTNYFQWFRIDIPPVGNFVGPIWVVLIGYAIIKHNLMNIKLIVTEAALYLINGILLTEIFLSTGTFEFVYRIILLSITVYISYIAITSAQNEIRQKEKNAQLASRLEEANKNLKELDKTKDDFLSMASHELNTPIAAIEGYLSMILVEGLGGKIPDKARKYLDSVFQSSQRLAHLVKDLLNVSRIESDRIHIIYEECQITDLINQAVMEIGSKVQEKHHTLTFKQAKAKMPTTWLDKTRITEVLINIIGNSVKYTPANGIIDIKVVHDDDKLVISVADNGKGIPNDRNAAVFEKFTQVDVLKDEVKGTGLGMYISKRFIELHKGKIWFHSDGADKGTTFFFSLPIYAKKPYDPFAGEGSVLH
jgi:signal transduction histidine kinase